MSLKCTTAGAGFGLYGVKKCSKVGVYQHRTLPDGAAPSLITENVNNTMDQGMITCHCSINNKSVCEVPQNNDRCYGVFKTRYLKVSYTDLYTLY
jgi:hypothetical protein